MLPNIYQHICVCAKYLFLTMNCILSASKGCYLDFYWGGRPANRTDRRTAGPTDGRTDRWTDRRTDRPSCRVSCCDLKATMSCTDI